MPYCSKCNEEIISEDEIVCSRCMYNFQYICEGLNGLAFIKHSKEVNGFALPVNINGKKKKCT
jgi:hypothetical protein